MDAQMQRFIVAAQDLWQSIIWPRYQPQARRLESAAPLVAGSLVTPARDTALLQTPQGLMVSAERLGAGVVRAVDAEGAILVRWSDADVETWVERADISALAAGWCLVTIARRDERGHRTILRRRFALLQHHWTIELLPDNVVRAARSDGLAWTFTLTPVNHAVIASWLYPPEDDDAEALTAAELAAA
jgi:hypothetical protein